MKGKDMSLPWQERGNSKCGSKNGNRASMVFSLSILGNEHKLRQT